MTKEITKAFLLQQLQDKLGLREFEFAKFLFDETVIPTYDIGQHLRVNLSMKQAISITGLGGYIFFTVPDDEKWLLNGYSAVFTGAGAIKVAGVYLLRRDETTEFIYLDLTKNQDVSYAKIMPYPFPLEHGDRISVNCDDYISTQNFELYIDITKETIR